MKKKEQLKIKNHICPHTDLSSFLCFFLCIFTCTFFIYRDFGIRMFYGFAVLGGLLIITVIQQLLHKKPPVITNFKTATILLCTVIFFFFLLPYSNKDSDNLSMVISMLICTVLIALSDSHEDMGRSIRVLKTTGICMAVFVLFFAVFEGLFWKTIGPFLSETAQQYLRYYVPRGYGITLGGCTFTDYVLVVGMGAVSAQLLFEHTSMRKRLLQWLSLFVCAAAVICVGRKGEVLALFATVVILLLIFATPEQRKKRGIILVAAVIFAVVAVIALLPVLRNITTLKRYVQMIDNFLAGKDFSSGRLELYELAWDLFLDHPLFGIGWGQFAQSIPADFHLAHNGGGVQTLKDVHCIYLQFLCESGLVGFVCIMVPICYCYIHTLKQMLRLQKKQSQFPQQKDCRILNYISFCIQTFVFVVGFIDPSFQRVQFWCFYGIALIMENNALLLENATIGGRTEQVLVVFDPPAPKDNKQYFLQET